MDRVCPERRDGGRGVRPGDQRPAADGHGGQGPGGRGRGQRHQVGQRVGVARDGGGDRGVLQELGDCHLGQVAQGQRHGGRRFSSEPLWLRALEL